MASRVAWIGLGVMGFPMAGHLKTRGGHELTVYNRTADKAESWVAQFGGRAAPTPRAGRRGMPISSSPASAMTTISTRGHDRAGRRLPGMKNGAVFIDHTTASANIARELHGAAKERGFGFIDAPVSGGQAGAENGVLTVMCGGDAGRL